jgi:hypothetical protein
MQRAFAYSSVVSSSSSPSSESAARSGCASSSSSSLRAASSFSFARYGIVSEASDSASESDICGAGYECASDKHENQKCLGTHACMGIEDDILGRASELFKVGAVSRKLTRMQRG